MNCYKCFTEKNLMSLNMVNVQLHLFSMHYVQNSCTSIVNAASVYCTIVQSSVISVAELNELGGVCAGTK